MSKVYEAYAERLVSTMIKFDHQQYLRARIEFWSDPKFNHQKYLQGRIEFWLDQQVYWQEQGKKRLAHRAEMFAAEFRRNLEREKGN